MLKEANRHIRYRSKPSDTLVAWLHLTDRCNLRCAYCYLPHVNENMTLETGRAALESIFRSARLHQFKKVQVKYAGGEPSLQAGLLWQLQDLALELSERYGVELDGLVLSNGTRLTGQFLQKLLERKLRLMISIDELGESPASQRVFAGGKPAAKIVTRAVERAVQMGIRPHLSITVTGRNAPSLAETVDWAICQGLTFHLNFYRENEYARQQNVLSLEEELICEQVRAVFHRIGNHFPLSTSLTGIVDRANLAARRETTCGVGINYVVVGCDGQLSRCHMAQKERCGTVFSPDPLACVRQHEQGVTNPPVQEKEQCARCAWRYACTGGCPLSAYRAAGSYTAPSPYCRIYQQLLPDLLLLEARRLIDLTIANPLPR